MPVLRLSWFGLERFGKVIRPTNKTRFQIRMPEHGLRLQSVYKNFMEDKERGNQVLDEKEF